jgi:chromosome segregation protein
VLGNENARQLDSIVEREQDARAESLRAEDELRATADSLDQARTDERRIVTRLDEARATAQRAQGELVSAEALQRAALGQAHGRVMDWLRALRLADRPRLAQKLKVDPGWERAVETALGSYLEAVCVEGIDAVAAVVGELSAGHVSFLSLEKATVTARPATSLLAHVEGPTAVASLLAGVFAADSLAEALARRERLQPGESIITRDGIWVGRHWLRVNRDAHVHEGVLEREQELERRRQLVASATAEVARLEGESSAARAAIQQLEQRREALQVDVNRAHQQHVGVQAQLTAVRERVGEAATRVERLGSELERLASEGAEAQRARQDALGRLEQASVSLHALEASRPALEAERDQLRQALDAARERARLDQARASDVAIQLESRRAAQSSTLASLERMRSQLAQLGARRVELAAQIEAGVAPLAEMERALQQAFGKRLAVESELRAARESMEAAEAELRALDEKRVACEACMDQARTAMDDARLAAQEIRVRRESIVEQFSATHFDLATLLSELAAEATVAAWEQSVVETGERIERLGSVNLAAIDEFKEQSERKEYLDRQFADLTEALTTLETAIRKIDRETRQRFQDTFDRINVGLKDKFPRLFGGGHAYLELTGEDVLSAGVAVMARPPGKRNSTIHLLSGGEKALTAVALVFSIFELNPAPFCLLDEVDAPLDDHNVGRFCDIVRDMAQRVQFLFITHNKATMELASQLIGVTMSEPGVSRLVAVDVEAAVRMAAM